ncbi:MAG: hypothetical protein ACUVSQ_06650 [Pseudanabaenaceae cyanobacterium]
MLIRSVGKEARVQSDWQRVWGIFLLGAVWMALLTGGAVLLIDSLR